MSSLNVYVIILLSIVSCSIGNLDNRAGPSEGDKEFHIQQGKETKRQPLWAEDETKSAELIEKVQHFWPIPQKNEIDNIMKDEELYAVTTENKTSLLNKTLASTNTVNVKKETEKPKATRLATSIAMDINRPLPEINETTKEDAKKLSWAEQEEYKSAEEIFEDPNPHKTTSNKAHTNVKPINDSSPTPMLHNFTQTTASLPNSLIKNNALQVTPKTNFMETIENPFAVPFWNNRKKYVRDQNIQHRIKRNVEKVDLDDESKSSSETGGISEEYLLFEEDRSHLMKRSIDRYVSGDLIVRGEIKTTPVVMFSSYNTLNKTITDDLVLKLETFLSKTTDGPFSKVTFLIMNISSDSNYNTVIFEVHWRDSDTLYGAQDDSQIRRDLAKVLLSIHQVGTYYINSSQIEDINNNMVPSICILCESYETCIEVTSNNWTCGLAENRTYPYGIPRMDNHLFSRNNEFASQKLYIEDYIPFQQTLHNEIWISVNGIISFGEEFTSFSPQRLPVIENRTKTYRHLLAPYWTDLDLVEEDEGDIFYQMYDCKKSDICIRANDDINKYAKISLYNATTVIVITWVKVPVHGSLNERVSFQCAIISNGYTTYAIYFYMQGAMHLKPASARNVEAGWGSVNLDSSRSVYYVFDTVMGNTGNVGVWFFKVGEQENYNMKCKSWYLSTPIVEVIRIDNNNLNLPACPCNELAARNSPIWITYISAQQDGRCYDLLPNYGEFGRRCCYRWNGTYIFETTKPQAGSLQRYNAFDSFMFKTKSHQINDLDPKQWCCNQSNLCELYYKLRPAGSCIASNWVRGFLFGDPHIVTLDQKSYIFNGLGEYKILEIKSSTNNANFIMQGRTCKAINDNGTEINATAWCAFAVKNENNNILRVEISSSRKIMIIYASYGNKFRDYSAQFQEPDFIAIENGMVLRKQNTSLEVAFPDSIGLSVSLNLGMLEFSVTLDKKYQSLTRGLLGNFNNDKTDDFIFQNGSRLPDNSTERILYQFGQSWAITQNESLFLYGYGQNTLTFSDPNFIPMFFDEQSTEAKSAAEAACGAYNIPCLFDFIATRNQEIAKKSLISADTFKAESTSTANQAPTVTLITQWITIKYNQSFSITINGSDIDGQIAEFKVFSDIRYNESRRYAREAASSTLRTYEFFASTTGLIQIGFSGVDDKSLCSEVAQVNITCCTNCNSNGKCSENVLRKTNNPYFNYAVCNCLPGYTGVDCDEDVDGCVGNPCPTGCIDAPASQQQVNGRAYTCKDCPAGFLLNTNQTKCEDIDECTRSPPSCDSHVSVCENVIGSFKCNCKQGYRNLNTTRCLDINECTEKLHNCDQICVNTLGSFNCTCLPGFNRKNGKCERIETDPCKLMNKNCSFNCRNGTNGPECFCPSGYQLKKTDNVSCEDVNECNENYCSQLCHNSIGTFNCSCFTGYSLNSNDNRSCDPCAGNKYGENCKSTCQCKGRAIRCDNVKGCICQNNWKGTECNEDVDECLKPNICPADHYCVNTNGSYSCDCPAGYEDINGTCVNINECTNVLLNNCSQVCIDTLGSFVCECENGYTKLSNGTCQDVNECANDASGCQQICVNVVGSSFCDCAVGYKLEDDRKTCVKEELDPCINFYLNCSFGCTIVDDVAQCFCGKGYVLSTNNYDCIDFDECKTNESQCSQSCENEPGAYKCSCQIGYKLQNDKTTCLKCDGYHWGENCATTCNCSTKGTERCDSIEGCKCKEGWSGKWCEKDQDECSNTNFPCMLFSTCINTPGSFDCQCKDGFIKVNKSCTDINECDDSPCDHICTNTISSYLCSCDKGFSSKGTKCYDINECEVKDLNNCDQKCRNTEGGFACECYHGYELNDTTRNTCNLLPTSTQCTNKCKQLCIIESNSPVCSCFQGYYLNDTECIDIDECESNPCLNGNCTNQNGTFLCSCLNGTKLLEDKLTCEDCISGQYGYNCAENCTCNTTNSKPQVCFAENGTCDCLNGWTGIDCSIDVDECNQSTNSCPTNSKCVNSPGSFRCVCEIGYFKSANFCLSCENNHYGQDCNEKCKCLKFGINTDSCDNVNGQCRCKPGWTGSSCETDINECLNTSYCPDIHESCFNLNGSVECRCNNGYHRITGSLCKDIDECLDPSNRCNFSTTICNNTDGSYVCECRPGHIDINSTTTCKVNYKTFPLEFEFDFSQQNLSSLIFIITTTESKDLQRKIARSLTKFGKEKYGDAVLSFEIYNLTNGSVIAHTNLQIDLLNTNVSDYVASSFAFELSTAQNFTIGDEIVTIMDVKVQNVSLKSIKDRCELYKKLSTCQPGQVCQTSSVPECSIVTTNSQPKENELIIGLSVGLGLFVILVIAIAIIIVLHIKRKNLQKDQSSTPSNDRESISAILSKSIATRKPLGYQSLYSAGAYLQPSGFYEQSDGQYIHTLQQQAGVLNQSGFSSDEPGPSGYSQRRRSKGSDLGLSEETEKIPDRSTSGFSWSHMFNLLDQHKGFTIKRPTFDSIPDLKADSPKVERNIPS